MHKKLAIFSVLSFVSLAFLAIMPGDPPRAAAQAEATPQMMVTSQFLAPPPTVVPATQADQGAQVYYYVCMTCHGDRGQGLTADFLNRLGPPDNNCWSSKCHAPNHVEGSFVFPKNVPAVVGPGVLSSFKTAKGLHDFIQQKMPFQAPGSLTEAQYWQLTAFLMRANGRDPGTLALDDARAATVVFSAAPSQANPLPASWFTIGGVLAALFLVGGLGAWRLRTCKK